MAKRDLAKKKDVVGLDIGSSSIKMAHLVENEEGMTLVGSEIKAIQAVRDPVAYENEVASLLQGIFSDPALRKATTVVTINCPQTSIKKITAPHMPLEDLREAIILGAKDHFSFPVDEFLIDFEITGDITEKGVKKYEVVLAACPKKTSDKYLSLLEKSGIRPASFISTSYALQKIAGHLYDKEDKARCFIDIGQSCTELVILKGKRLLFNRKIPVTGNDFTKALTSTLVSERGRIQLSWDEAEKIKREVGIPAEPGPALVENKITNAQILSLLRSPVEYLVNETERCFEYYREEAMGQGIEEVVLFGGSASLKGLVAYMTERLGVDVRIGYCLEGFKADKSVTGDDKCSVDSRLELAIGAALGGAEGIDLLPANIKRREKIAGARNTAIAAAACVMAISLVLYTGMTLRVKGLERRMRAAENELSNLQPQLKKAEMQILANKILMNEPQWEDVFTELSGLVPDSVILKGLTMKYNLLTMKGVAETDDGERVLADFINALEKGIFNNVKVVSIKKLERGQGTEFELNCWVDYE